MRERPRRQFHFPAVQTATDLDYVPKPTRDEALAAEYKGKPSGIVIARLQKVGSAAAARAFTKTVETGDSHDISDMSNLLSIVSFGTAYHVYAQHEGDKVMYRQVPLPNLVDPDSKERMSRGELIAQAQNHLAHTAQVAIEIEKLLLNRSDFEKANLYLGRSFARAGVLLAALKEDLPQLRLEEVEMQHEAWRAAQSTYARTLELSGQIGARPTIAQIADDQSPFRRFMNDNPDFVSQTVHSTLVDEVDS